MNTFTEKRLYPRITVKLPVKIHLDNLPAPFDTEVVDLSEGGVRFTFPEDMDIPKYLTLEFKQPTLPYKVEITSEVKWQNRVFCGVEFKTSKKKELDNIKKLLWLCEEYIERNIEPLLIKVEANRPEASDLVKNFFMRDVKSYLENISAVYKDIENKKMGEETGYQRINKFINDILREGAELLKKVNSKILTIEIKKTFRAMTGNWIYESAYMKRGFEKPRGYPGDHVLIEAIYNNRPNSEGIGTFFDRFFLNNSYASSVRHRKDKAVTILRDFFDRHNLPEAKILNLGSGSCRELKEFFNNPFSFKNKVIITNVDYDEEALEYSKQTLSAIPDNVEIRFLKEDILRLPREENYYQKLLGKQDLIYSLGLIDYIPDRILKDSIAFWYKLLEKDGILVLAHKDIDAAPEAPYAPDWYCDWKFVTRNREYFIDLVKNSISGHNLLKEERDKTGKIIFLFVNKLSN